MQVVMALVFYFPPEPRSMASLKLAWCNTTALLFLWLNIIANPLIYFTPPSCRLQSIRNSYITPIYRFSDPIPPAPTVDLPMLTTFTTPESALHTNILLLESVDRSPVLRSRLCILEQ